MSDRITWRCVWTIEKYWGEAVGTPYDTVVIDGNLALNEGITEALKLIGGISGTNAFSFANARVGVGDSSTAAAATQTDLQAGVNKAYAVMNAGYPQVSGQTITFQGTFDTTAANYAWNEWVVDNGSTGLKTLNRKVQSQGTKTSAESWVMSAAITMS